VGTPAQPGARTALLDAAERLFAERGIGSVSLREVGAAAGQRNNSAAQYHFGSRDGLLRAVFERRMGPINDRRRAMLDDLGAEGRTDDRRALVEALVLPLAESVTSTDESCYARFLAQVLASGLVGSGEDALTEAFRDAHGRLVAGLDHVPATLRRVRVDHAVLLAVHALAAWEQSRSLDRMATAPSLLVVDLVDSALGLLDAPATSLATSLATTPATTPPATTPPATTPPAPPPRPTPGPTLELAC
jgi:AcrR family transcriptional regulator